MAACPATHAHVLGDPCLRREHRFARLVLETCEMGIPEAPPAALQRLMENTFARAHEHLTLGPEAWEAEGRRGLWLWGLINISATQQGADLRIDYLGRDSGDEITAATVNLSLPISLLGFLEAISPILAAEAKGCGLPPDTLEGTAGTFIRRVFARTFLQCVDWIRLRRAVSAYLQLRAPYIHEVTRDRHHGRHISAHEMRASRRPLSPFEVGVRRRRAAGHQSPHVESIHHHVPAVAHDHELDGVRSVR